MSFKVYLVGAIPKGDKEKAVSKDWKVEYKAKLQQIKDIEFLDFEDLKNESDPLVVFGHDCSLIQKSDAVVINAISKLGAGSSQEMVIAKYFNKPVITVLPKDTHHRRSNIVFHGTEIEDWIHPFVYAMSDIVVENIDEAVAWLHEYQQDSSSKKIKSISFIDDGISYYKSKE